MTLGGLFGNLAHFLFPDHTASAGAYALVGMGAVLAGAAHAPLTALLMAFEITNDYQIILPVMIACSISAIITRRYAKESLYTMKLARRGINIQAGREVHVLRALTVGDSMHRNVTCVQENMKFGELLDFISRSPYSDFPVLDDNGKLVGMISFQGFKEVAFEKGLEDVIIVRELMSTDLVTVTERDDLHHALEKISTRDMEQLLVVDPRDPTRVIGMLSRRDILTAYNKALLQLRTPRPDAEEPPPSPPAPA
jgi:CIC family chloride channel protein